MGTLNVDKLDPESGTALEIGTSGDTVTVPSGVTLTTTNATVNLPASVGGLGTGIDVTSQITGVVPTANLGSGSASSSTVLYGDQTYKAEPGGAWNLLRTEPASGASSVEFVDGVSGVDLTTYKMYKLLGIDLDVSDNDSNPIILWSDDGGVSYETSNYNTSNVYLTYAGSVTAFGTTSETLFLNNMGNGAGETGCFEFTFPNPSSSLNKQSFWTATVSPATGNMRFLTGGSTWTSTAAVDAFQFKIDSGTFSGTLKLYGIS